MIKRANCLFLIIFLICSGFPTSTVAQVSQSNDSPGAPSAGGGAASASAPTTAQTEMQWDDPFDPADPPLNQPPIYQNTGTITAANAATGDTFTDIPAFAAARSSRAAEGAVGEAPVPARTGGDDSRKPIRREEPKVGRNDPCPCGSGKKFKKCCGLG